MLLKRLLPLLPIILVAPILVIALSTGRATNQPTQRESLERDFSQGNYSDAYDGLRQLCLDPSADPGRVPGDLNLAVRCLQELGRVAEIDELIEDTVAAHVNNWRLLAEAAQQYLQIQKDGFIIAGRFERGPHRGGGLAANVIERDRVRALQLMVQALPLTRQEDSKREVAQFHRRLADMLLASRGYHEAWRLGALTELSRLPDADEGYYLDRSHHGAPVDAEGQPIFYELPGSWDAARNDGQRWRWALAEAVEHDPSLMNEVRWRLGQFHLQQFGVQTLLQGVPFRGFGAPQDDGPSDSGTYALHTLGADETIARLASGIKRLTLPDEFNFIKTFQQIAAEPQTGYGEDALNALAEIFENRRQYPRAAEYWRESIRSYGDNRERWKQKRLEQIVGNWGRFEMTTSQPAGSAASVEFLFRNARQVHFEARRINVARLLDDVKAYLRSSPRQLDYQKFNLDNLGWQLVQQDAEKYVGEKVAQWSEQLSPRESHFDRRITIATPLRDAGAYLLTARIPDGNQNQIVIWVSDTAIVQKQLSGKNLYYVADAVSGAPIAGANVEFFGFRQEHMGGRRYRVLTSNFAERTDDDGTVTPDPRDLSNEFQWVVIARTEDGRLAHLGFRGVWTGHYYDHEYKETKVFTITDRPVYRPEQTVHFKLWVRHAQYDRDDSHFAGQTFPVELHDPKGEKIQSWSLKSDEYGGLQGQWQLPPDAMLGVYQLQIKGLGGGNFRVEEYKKPEFEVTVDAPAEPVMLGEQITAKIRAKYYFGSPVTNATVRYKILRSDYAQDWYPLAPWDWCYGRGYWWFAYDYEWYPGWQQWAGCLRPSGWWWPLHRNPPELVAEQEVSIGPDGAVDVEIDTALAKELHADTDHQYTIVAEVRDQSRRTIVGQGQVLVARKPFRVFSWVNRGYYRAGDTIQAHFLAQTLDNKPVRGSGRLTLYRVTYRDDQPVETAVQQWDLDTDDEGRAALQLQASRQGQYRLSYQVTDAKGHAIEGGYLFTVTAAGFDGREFRFNNLELIPDKREYQAGETVRLQINTDRVGSTVLLFVRPANGVYLPPKLLRLDGKSTIEEIAVVKRDMPNFFVEAVTLADGKVYNETKEIVVPPEKRVLNVEVLPSGSEFLPGERATVKLHLTDFDGNDFVGSTVVSIYDKAVEYISGGSNVPDIKEFFWKWRRHHAPSQQTSLDQYFAGQSPENEPGMSAIGVFGHTLADDLDANLNGIAEMKSMGGGRRYAMRGGMARGEALDFAAPAATMAAEGEPSNEVWFEQSGETAAPGDAGLISPQVRSNFADTALWVGSLTTDAQGLAEVSLDMPENLTTWKVKVWGMGHGTQVGSGEAEIVTRKNLILRLQAPRFLVQKDEVVLSANIHNYLASDKQVTATLELPGDQLQPLSDPVVQLLVPAGGERRVDWRVKVLREGVATVRMQALTDEESDAMQVPLPVYVHGMLKTESWAGTLRPDQDSQRLTIRVPSERRVEQSVLEIRYSPSLAGAMVDALPYLADYPYGCTEQTLNRFLPTVITQKILLEMNLNLDEIRDKRTNLNAQEIGDDRERAAGWQRYDRNPVFDRDELDRMVKEGVTRLTNMQLSDGGWGWFSGWGERSYPHTTAVVVHGLQIAQQNDVPLVPGVLEKGIDWLERYQDEQLRLLNNAAQQIKPYKNHADNLDAFVYMVLVDDGRDDTRMRQLLYRDRNLLAVYAKAMFALALDKQGDQARLSMVRRNIEQFLVQDAENETAYLQLPADNYWWYWYGSDVEANAYYLKLLARVEPRGVTAARLVKYLLNNRKHATYWNSTRDTAVCVEAFADYLRGSGETQPNMVVEILLDGQLVKQVEITGENIFSFDNRFLLAGAELADGEHEIEIRRRGEGPVYFNAYLTNFTLEDPITEVGLEVKVERHFYRLVPVEASAQVAGSRGQPAEQRVEKYERQPLEDLAMLASGELVEVELVIESKNDYEYLVFEDMKAAGLEPVEVRSGYTYAGLPAYTEFRDDRVSFFIRHLARGRHSVSYRLRAETPGRFSALPARGYAMYAPELRGNSAEIKLQIEDRAW